MGTLAMVVGKVSSQPTKLEVIIKESNKTDERQRNKDTVMLTKSRSRCTGQCATLTCPDSAVSRMEQ